LAVLCTQRYPLGQILLTPPEWFEYTGVIGIQYLSISAKLCGFLLLVQYKQCKPDPWPLHLPFIGLIEPFSKKRGNFCLGEAWEDIKRKAGAQCCAGLIFC
jgi:hypothetical protein